MKQIFYIIRILLNRKITRIPLRVLRELQRQGKQRIPGKNNDGTGKRQNPLELLSFIKYWLGTEMLSRHNKQWVLNSFLPPFPSVAFERMFTNLLSGRHLSPVSANLAVTSQCEYNCWHCSYQNKNNNDLTTQQWETIIDQLHDIGNSIFGITGGEPLLRDDLPQIISSITQKGGEAIIYSTGYGLTRERAQELKSAGLWAFCVSLDSTIPDEHDKKRGYAGAFNAAIEAINIAKDAGLYTMIGSVATKSFTKNREFETLYQLAKELGVQEYRLVEPMPCGKLNGETDEMLLSKEDIKTLREFHCSTNKRGQLPKVCAFNQIESPEVFGCGAGTQHLYINAEGKVFPCDFTPLNFGNILEEGMNTIWARMNKAMGDNPRRNCFIQKNHKLINSCNSCDPKSSAKVCAMTEPEPLPDYFALVTGQRNESKINEN